MASTSFDPFVQARRERRLVAGLTLVTAATWAFALGIAVPNSLTTSQAAASPAPITTTVSTAPAAGPVTWGTSAQPGTAVAAPAVQR